MKKIYTFFNTLLLLALCNAALLSSITAKAQNCGNVVENFNNPSNGSAGFTGDLIYPTTGPSGYLIKDKVVALGAYSVTTPTYQLSNTATNVGYGFTLSGAQQVSRVIIQIVYISTLNDELTRVFLDEVTPAYDLGTGKASICASTSLANLPGFPAGAKYRFQIELTSSTGTGKTGENITFDDFMTNGTTALAPLPVSFIGFDAKKIGSAVLLTWKVAGEENVNRYEVERSDDGLTFATISSITHGGRDTYVYTDASNRSSAYYRIKNVDEDGKYKYSTILRISNGKSEILLKAFPQPVQSQLTIQYPNVSGKALISVSTADGKLVRSLTPPSGSMQASIDMSGLQKGLYIIRLDAGDGNARTLKVVKQ